MGGVGLLLMRNALLDQWQETAIEKLQRTAHYVDMRLMRPKELLLFLQEESSLQVTSKTHNFIVDQLQALDEVVEVEHEWEVKSTRGRGNGSMGGMQGENQKRYHHLEQLTITSPQYNAEFESETVSLTIYFKDSDDIQIGYIDVVLSFNDLIEEVVEAPWWKSNEAYLLDTQGNILASTQVLDTDKTKGNKFADRGLFEERTFSAMEGRNFGTIFNPGLIPDQISGFYRLTEAPWTMVVVAPGRKVLEPIITLGTNFLLVSAIGILLVLLIIHIATGKTTHAIKRVSDAAKDLAQGTFGEPLEARNNDEVGELTNNFNSMTRQLQERLLLKEAIGVASEVQKNFLPQEGFKTDKLEIEGTVIYCDETGGDYFDLLQYPEHPGKVGVVVGDVVGHGIGAALLMATVRALIRSCSSHFESPSTAINAVNEFLCLDTFKTGNFVTLIYLVINRDLQSIRWVRCGHDPAVVFSPNSGQFTELRGEGIVLGIDTDYSYKEYCHKIGDEKQVLLIGSDGVWEAENEEGEQFGKERLNKLLATNHELPLGSILDLITEKIRDFRGNITQRDDITLTIIKINYE